MSTNEALLNAQETIQKQEELLNDLLTQAIKYATAVSVNETSVVLVSSNEYFEAVKPKNFEINAGDVVKILPETGQITEVVQNFKLGDVGTIVSLAGDYIDVEVQGRTRHIFTNPNLNLEEGDKVVLDSHHCAVLKKLENTNKQQEFKAVTWEDIGGLQDAKMRLREVIEVPINNPNIYEHYSKKIPSGVLLYGPPGCGKTLLANAVATALMGIYSNDSGRKTAYVYVKGPELLSPFVGATEERIQSLFTGARKHKTIYGYPAVIFIDEAEAILQKRGSGISSDVNKTIVPMFLTEMSGLEDSGAFIILATNRPDQLDPAVTRDGRIDIKIPVYRPNLAAAKDILSIYLKAKPIDKTQKFSYILDFAINEIYSDDKVLYELKDNKGETYSFKLSHLLSGSMLANVVESSANLAIRRDLATKKISGVTKEDIKTAIQDIYHGLFNLDHRDDLELFAEQYDLNIVSIKKAKERYAKTNQ